MAKLKDTTFTTLNLSCLFDGYIKAVTKYNFCLMALRLLYLQSTLKINFIKTFDFVKAFKKLERFICRRNSYAKIPADIQTRLFDYDKYIFAEILKLSKYQQIKGYSLNT